tara:strand:- start:570 stop:1097 length:528 start_codon:yes stop_codon:yes gene_type:complete
MENRPQIFACVGPESTGKTTLCGQLASRFGGAIVPEIARGYLTFQGGIYQQKDLITIAKKQLELESRITFDNKGPIFCDTDVLVVKVWQEFKYGESNSEIDLIFSKQQSRKYLLTYPDLEWQPDSLRENPNELLEIFNYYEKTLTEMGADYRIVRGNGEERLKCAIDAINQMNLG